MNRRALLAALGAAAGAGCLDDGAGRSSGESGGDGGNGNESDTGNATDDESSGFVDQSGVPVRESFDGEVTRPECERESKRIEVEYADDTHEYETAETIPYPDPPATGDEADLIAYLEAFDEAYVTHDVLCERAGSSHILRIGHSIQNREQFDWYEDVLIVFFLRAAGATAGADDGGVWEADLGFSGVIYAIDESGVARAAYDDAGTLEPDAYEANAPDPLEDGELVETFEDG
ncbi:hypothetical protein [Natronosalvus vescus]|uniref:hypothetical protein n=1 Tax=Natronosalvus vescus TaxID=2953881 RepID=UPI002090F922|nr:hypothetical protein [Natronosalvus vescus]